MTSIKVGEIYKDGFTSWEVGSEYNFMDGDHTLRIFIEGPTEQEIEAVGLERARFDIYKERNILFLSYAFGKHLIGICPYHLQMVPEESRLLPDEMPDVLNVILVDANTGIVMAVRAVPMPLNICTTLGKIIQSQVSDWFTNGWYNNTVSEIRAKHGYKSMRKISFIYFRDEVEANA